MAHDVPALNVPAGLGQSWLGFCNVGHVCFISRTGMTGGPGRGRSTALSSAITRFCRSASGITRTWSSSFSASCTGGRRAKVPGFRFLAIRLASPLLMLSWSWDVGVSWMWLAISFISSWRYRGRTEVTGSAQTASAQCDLIIRSKYTAQGISVPSTSDVVDGTHFPGGPPRSPAARMGSINWPASTWVNVRPIRGVSNGPGRGRRVVGSSALDTAGRTSAGRWAGSLGTRYPSAITSAGSKRIPPNVSMTSGSTSAAVFLGPALAVAGYEQMMDCCQLVGGRGGGSIQHETLTVEYGGSAPYCHEGERRTQARRRACIGQRPHHEPQFGGAALAALSGAHHRAQAVEKRLVGPPDR